MRAFSESISVELKDDNIDVITVSPSPMDTGYEKNQKLIGIEKSPYDHRKKMISAGLENVKKYHPKIMANSFEEVYKEIN